MHRGTVTLFTALPAINALPAITALPAIIAISAFTAIVATPSFGGEIQRTQVTKDGIVQVRTHAPDPFLSGPTGGALAANPNPSTPGLTFTYPNPAATPWITSSVSVGNHGTFHWLGQDLNFRTVSLVSSTEDNNPAFPIWEDALPNATLASVEVAAADKSTLAAAVFFDLLNGNNEIRVYDAFSSIPVATSNNLAAEASISDDGQKIAIGYRNAGGFAEATVYDPGLTPIQTVTTTGAPLNFVEHDLSADGSTLLLANLTEDFVFDVATGALLHQDASTVGHQAHVIDGDGDTWGRGGFDVGLWKRIGGSYQRILTFDDPTFINSSGYTACDLSADGSTFVVAAIDAANWLDLRVYCWAVGATSTTLLWTYTTVGSGAWQDTPQAVSVSDDGQIIAVGTWGTQFNNHPEVLVFDRDQGNTPIASVDTPGSCFALDLSGDGQRLAVGTKSIHANVNGNGGEGYGLDLGGQGFWIEGTPSVGRTISLRASGTPGDQIFLLASLGLLPSPISAGGFTGGLWLDPVALFLPPTLIANIPGGGDVTLPVPLPANPAIVGLTVFAQVARVTGGPNAFEDFVRLPFTP